MQSFKLCFEWKHKYSPYPSLRKQLSSVRFLVCVLKWVFINVLKCSKNSHYVVCFAIKLWQGILIWNNYDFWSCSCHVGVYSSFQAKQYRGYIGWLCFVSRIKQLYEASASHLQFVGNRLQYHYTARKARDLNIRKHKNIKIY